MTKSKAKILVVDDSPETLELLHSNCAVDDYTIFSVACMDDAVKVLEHNVMELVITALVLSDESGLDLVRHIRNNYRTTEVMVVAGSASVEMAVQAVKAGAEEFLVMPVSDQKLWAAIERTLNKLNDRKAYQTPESEPILKEPCGLLGEAENIKKVYTKIKKASVSNATVLIAGESGTGKELVARAIHYNSNRASAPFVPVNCGGIPENLLESELFGYVKGAFTGANVSRAGFFQTADGGTIFLDEVSETSLAMQVKLLRVLQDREVYMVGANHSRKVDVRIVVASNKNLLQLVEQGSFREDLYFRLNVITIDVPPLRDRDQDICLLIGCFATKYAKEMGKPVPTFSDQALQVLHKYHWPGNVRELENMVQQLVVMTDRDVIDAPDLPSLLRYKVSTKNHTVRSLAEIEFEHIQNVLHAVEGNKTKAAEMLGIDRKTLREKLKRCV